MMQSSFVSKDQHHPLAMGQNYRLPKKNIGKRQTGFPFDPETLTFPIYFFFVAMAEEMGEEKTEEKATHGTCFKGGLGLAMEIKYDINYKTVPFLQLTTTEKHIFPFSCLSAGVRPTKTLKM